jgi:hypothetical protein
VPARNRPGLEERKPSRPIDRALRAGPPSAGALARLVILGDLRANDFEGHPQTFQKRATVRGGGGEDQIGHACAESATRNKGLRLNPL